MHHLSPYQMAAYFLIAYVNIEEVIARFITSARLVKEAGFTGVQIHCAHGYLLSQFLSPKINQRQDQWGGTLENRARIIRRIIVGVRKAVGTDFPIGVKLNSADFQKGGFSLEDCITVAKWLGEDSVDLLEISGGTYEQLSSIGVELTDVRESTRKREAYFIEYAERIKQFAKIPVMITGGFRSRIVMERAIESGEVGFYYWQIIRLSRGLAPETQLGTFKAFLRHMTNDFKLSPVIRLSEYNSQWENRPASKIIKIFTKEYVSYRY